MNILHPLLDIWLPCCAIILVIEHFRPAEINQPVRLKLFNLYYGVIYGLLLALFLAPFSGKLTSHFTSPLINVRIPDGIWKDIVAGIVIYLITDFFYYWLHRAQHYFPWLWEQHSFHHSETALNVTTGMRHHWLEPIFQAVAIGVPITVLFKIPPVESGVILFIFSAWGFFIHANLRVNMGMWSKVIVGPQAHRIHHSVKIKHKDKNFAAYFPLWDILFGTFYLPEKDEFPATGLYNGETPKNMVYALVWPVRKLFKAL